MKWGKFLDGWIEGTDIPPGTYAAVELEDTSIIYVSIMYLNGPLGEDFYWPGGKTTATIFTKAE